MNSNARLSLGTDRNGNKTLKVSTPEGSFSIQTNQNLPRTHRDGICLLTRKEVKEFVESYGTNNQKKLVSLYFD